jgi:predicted acyl esterase
MSGWADLIASLYGNETQHLQSTGVLALAGYLTGRPGPELQSALSTFFTSDYPKENELKEWARIRSPQTYLSRFNANHPAVMLANAWGDSIFPPNQITPFFEGLTGPKRLEFRPGDHATAEFGGLFGLPNDTWSDATAWLDHYLRGVDNGVDRKPAVHLEPQLQDGYEDYANWQSVSTSALRLDLGRERWTGSGNLGPQPDTGWDTSIGTWADSGADGGTVFLSSLAEQFLKLPPMVSVPLLPRAVSAVWQSAPYPVTERVRGTPHLHLGVTPSASHGSLIAYLYDVDALGIGRLVTHAPYTFLDAMPGRSFDVDLDLQATAYDVPAGHHLALVVDAVDPLYITHNPSGARLVFDSPAHDPASLTVPVNEAG